MIVVISVAAVKCLFVSSGLAPSRDFPSDAIRLQQDQQTRLCLRTHSERAGPHAKLTDRNLKCLCVSGFNNSPQSCYSGPDEERRQEVGIISGQYVFPDYSSLAVLHVSDLCV